MDVVGVISNCPRQSFQSVDLDDALFEHILVTRATGGEQEARL